MPSFGPLMTATPFPVAASQTRMSPSVAAVTIRLPSGVKGDAHDFRFVVVPLQPDGLFVRLQVPDEALAVAPPDTARFPSRLTATL
jgi:hypothetical protein